MFFRDNTYNEISGILYSNEYAYSYTHGNTNALGRDCVLFKNPFAKNELPDEFSSKFANDIYIP